MRAAGRLRQNPERISVTVAPTAPNTDGRREAPRLRIAQLAPMFESVPPRLYGGTERVVDALTRELTRRGHEVTLFASGDSDTPAELVACSERSLRLEGRVRDHVAFTIVQLAELVKRSGMFDIVHNHIDYYAFPFAMQSTAPMVTTTHGRMDLPEVHRVYRHFSTMPLVSISDAQRTYLPDCNWIATVLNGLNLDRYHLNDRPEGYLAFLGRMSPEKRPDRAIEAARELGLPLKLAAKIDPVDREYFEHAIRPLLAHPGIEFVGEIDDREKDAFLGNASAYLFPIDWPEPFGLTMIEAMACGTPVIAMDFGSVREVVADGVSGFICRSFGELCDAIGRIDQIDRAACRQHAIDRFSAARMADGYERVYRDIVRAREPAETAGARRAAS
jgi:glycosyltransferase involved in cell wall biosynthesis